MLTKLRLEFSQLSIIHGGLMDFLILDCSLPLNPTKYIYKSLLDKIGLLSEIGYLQTFMKFHENYFKHQYGHIKFKKVLRTGTRKRSGILQKMWYYCHIKGRTNNHNREHWKVNSVEARIDKKIKSKLKIGPKN